MTTTKALTNRMIPSGEKDNPFEGNIINSRFNTYKIKKYAVLVDHTTVIEDIPKLSEYDFCGFYTFEIKLEGHDIMGQPIQLITLDSGLPSCDGWLVASTSRAACFGLNKALMVTRNENQIITRLYDGQTTDISAYMDMFSGETETVIYINHYFDRKYRIVLPIDIRYIVCECDGTIVRHGQKIIPPGGIIVFNTKEMQLGNFIGYLRVKLQVENLQTRVQPFIHFWADYISDNGICRNHQSGWAPWPEATVFNRGYFPCDPHLETICSFYNDNDCVIQPKLLLHYTQNGEEKIIERSTQPILAKHMSYQNISKIFEDIPFEGGSSAYFLISCDEPLHRPNNYICIKGTKQFVDSYHQTGGKACHWAIPSTCFSSLELEKFKRLNIFPWLGFLPILHKKFRIDTYLGLLSPTICDIDQFTFFIWNEKGELIFSKDEIMNSNSSQFLNLNEYIREQHIPIQSGLFGYAPRVEFSGVPRGTVLMLGFQHKDFKYISTSFGGSARGGLPFIVSSVVPYSREYTHCPLQTSDKFGVGVVSEEFDSLYIFTNVSLLKNYNKETNYRLEVFDASGKLFVTSRTIQPQGHDAFWLSEILKKQNVASHGPYYTVWAKNHDIEMKSFHMLYRKRDHALACDDMSEGTLQREPQV